MNAGEAGRVAAVRAAVAELRTAHPRLVAALTVALIALAALIAAAVAVTGSSPGTTARRSPGVNAVEQRMQHLRDALAADFNGQTTPGDDVVRHVRSDNDTISGTLALPDSSGTCWGFTVDAGAAWVLTGQADALRLGPVTTLDPQACRP